MATKIITGQVQIRNDTAQNWAVANPVLLVGELGYETDTHKGKVGDGQTTWNSLGYVWGVSLEALTYLPLSGGTLTGVVNGVTPPNGDNSKKLATTEFVNAKAGNYLPLSGGTLTGGLIVEGTITGNLAGNADTATNATNATNDANGNPIASTYLPLSGGTISGDLSVSGAITGNVTGDLTGTASGNLALTGGTMTGSIQYVENGKVFAIGKTDGGNVDLGWNWANREGAGLGLRSTDHSHPGEFILYARDANNDYSLSGKPGGSLTWGGKEVERVSAKGTYGIRFESGIQICWGELTIPAGTSGREVSGTMTFPYPFANTAYSLTFGNTWCDSSSEYYRSEGKNTANFKFTAVGVSPNKHAAFYIAIGYWK